MVSRPAATARHIGEKGWRTTGKAVTTRGYSGPPTGSSIPAAGHHEQATSSPQGKGATSMPSAVRHAQHLPAQ